LFVKNDYIVSNINLVLKNKYYRKWNLAWGQAPLDDFNEGDLMSSRFSIVSCRLMENNKFQLVPWQDMNGGRLSYLNNDEFYIKNSLQFQRNTMRLNWDLEIDREKIVNHFNNLSLKIATFDFHVKKKLNVLGYEFFLIEHFPVFTDQSITGWTLGEDSRMRKKIYINSTSIENYNGIPRIDIPPGHLNTYKRSKLTREFICERS